MKSSIDNVSRYSPASITTPEFNELTGGSSSQPFANSTALRINKEIYDAISLYAK